VPVHASSPVLETIVSFLCESLAGSSLEILKLLAEDAHLQTKRGYEGDLELSFAPTRDSLD
jgi:hypothetical protein